MKCFLLLAVAFVLAGATGCTAPQKVRVLTYNIHHGEGLDGVVDLPRIAGVIQSERPDLVAVQEVDNQAMRSGGVDQAAELGRLTGMHSVFGKAMDYQGGGYGQAVLSRWPILESEVFPLGSAPGLEPRILLLTRIRLGEEGPVIWFASTHLDHNARDTNRFNEAVRLNEILTAKGTDPIVLAGDFNDTPESRVLAMLLKHWTDASALNPEPTIPSRNPRRRIDYILFRPLNRWKAVETRVLPEAVASDHRPVFAVLEYLGRK